MEGHGGVRECRKVIHDVRSIPRDQLAYYKRSGVVQRYMRPQLEAIENGSYRIPEYEIRELLRSGYGEKTIMAYIAYARLASAAQDEACEAG